MDRIPGVIVRPLARHTDSRGWLLELFRDDELPDGFEPAMAYISMTGPGVARGPHEHAGQTDGFAFVDGRYEVYLWENRPGQEEAFERFEAGSENPLAVYVPPGVVHAYRNVGDRDAFVINFPDRLYAGRDKAGPVDEIRHESDPDSRFRLPD
ncbi:MAG: dTDP-4-dehydrorhamnose 3,5-epimerase family protein [Armatimonadetes bacterium]|nr:dTDP-4-dehydrorhamnose 3,5-epimerase family protein [Armatimonadota bacterium]